MESDDGKFEETEKERSSSCGERNVLKEGWCTKESGTTLFGASNWRQRWFTLFREDSTLTLAYYKQINDSQPKGKVCLDSTYTARELETSEEKGKANCFAVGPLFNDPSIRTYYISCESEEEKLDWMCSINASIEGCPTQAQKHAKSFRKRYNRISSRKIRPLPSDESCNFADPGWRIQQWRDLCERATETSWKKTDTKNGITVARQTFKNNSFAVIKTEGIVSVSPEVTLEYLQRAIELGGKLDYPFRNAKLVQNVIDTLPPADIFYNKFDVPIPGISTRDCLWLRMKIQPDSMPDKKCGLLFVSVSQTDKDPEKNCTRIKLACSGIVICPEVLQDNTVHTRVIFLAQIDVQNSLQSMLEGSYKSGLLKVGLRNAFSHVRSNIEEYNNMLLGI